MLSTDDNEQTLREHCVSQLTDFLSDETEKFVTALFEAIKRNTAIYSFVLFTLICLQCMLTHSPVSPRCRHTTLQGLPTRNHFPTMHIATRYDDFSQLIQYKFHSYPYLCCFSSYCRLRTTTTMAGRVPITAAGDEGEMAVTRTDPMMNGLGAEGEVGGAEADGEGDMMPRRTITTTRDREVAMTMADTQAEQGGPDPPLPRTQDMTEEADMIEVMIGGACMVATTATAEIGGLLATST